MFGRAPDCERRGRAIRFKSSFLSRRKRRDRHCGLSATIPHADVPQFHDCIIS